MAFVVRLRAGFDRSRFVSASSDQLKQAVRAELDQLFTRLASSSKAGNA
jgi:ribonuclease P protein component